ncbi:MAG: ABC transporter ATP-binding protein [Lachnospiraceae bacterium]|nr:ABC transporter ATP-binding protein [Lachnospiraceae bacterium]
MNIVDYISLNFYFFEWLITGIGCALIFRKDGIKGIYSFIPGLQQYFLAVEAEREEDGRTYFILAVCRVLANLMRSMFKEGSPVEIMWLIVAFALWMACLLFGIRIFIALCDVFCQKRRWTWLWLFFPGITSMIWGISPKFMPVHKTVSETDFEKAAKISEASIEAVQNGLTVNLTDRTVMNLGKKAYLLKDIHLSIPVGHMVLLLGGSGAGKTTFLNAVTGYEKANAEIILRGRNFYNNYESMKYDLGFVPQQDLMRTSDTVRMTLYDTANLRLPANMPRNEKKERVSLVMEKLGLSSVAKSQVGKLSGGQRKRLSIALELISDPTLFILDEPDSGLDGVVARNLFQTLRGIADEGRIVIVITHTPDRVIDLFDDVIVLAKDAALTGRLAYYGPVGESYEFFGRNSMEDILRCINQKDEGGEGRADEFVEKYSDVMEQLSTEAENA